MDTVVCVECGQPTDLLWAAESGGLCADCLADHALPLTVIAGPATCVRCGHPVGWHRLDDSRNLDPTDPATPFRCIGYDCERPGSPRPCAVACPDFVAIVW